MTVLEIIQAEEQNRIDLKIDPVLCCFGDLYDQYKGNDLKGEINKLVKSGKIKWGFNNKGKYFKTI